MTTPRNLARILFLSARPWALLNALLSYAVGLGVCTYLGQPVEWTSALTGLGCVLLLLVAGAYLTVYFGWFLPGFRLEGEEEQAPNPFPRPVFMQLATACLATGAVLTTVLYLQSRIYAGVFLILGIFLLLTILKGVPPFRLVDRGYGELVEAVMVCCLPAFLSMLIQTGEIHRFCAILILPVTLLYLAGAIAESMPDFSTHLKYERRTLMMRMGWQTGMILHNVLILSAYLLLVCAVLLGVPFNLAVPSLLTLFLAAGQIWLVQKISNGEKPHWNWLLIMARSLPLLVSYLLTAALWME